MILGYLPTPSNLYILVVEAVSSIKGISCIHYNKQVLGKFNSYAMDLIPFLGKSALICLYLFIIISFSANVYFFSFYFIRF